MNTAQLDRARTQERKLDRRAARTQRSKWLGRLLFSLIGMSLLLFVRLNPELVMKAALVVQGMKSQQESASLTAPAGEVLRKMPKDFVPVRRGGDLPGNGTRAPQKDVQLEADAVSDQLQSLDPSR